MEQLLCSDTYWLEIEEDKVNGAFSLVMPLINFNSITHIGWLRVNVKKEDVFQAINSRILGEMGNLRIINNTTEQIIYSSNGEIKLGKTNDEEYLIVEQLINEVYRSDISKKEAELQMLQNQINPHFLYNTLSTISSLAKLGELDQMHQMVLGLSNFYRLVMEFKLVVN